MAFPVAPRVALAQGSEVATSGAIISEFRFRGPGGSSDEFVEINNRKLTPLNISGWTLRTNRGTAAAPDFAISTVPPNSIIPGAGRFLFTGSAYSLARYGTGDAALNGDAADDSGVALFNAAGALQDAVGFVSSHATLREGAGLPSAPTGNGEGAFVRDYTGTLPRDSADSSQDFVFVVADADATNPTALATVAGTTGNVAAFRTATTRR